MSPTLTIVRGQASAEELAALTAAVVYPLSTTRDAVPPVHQSKSPWSSALTWQSSAGPFGRRH